MSAARRPGPQEETCPHCGARFQAGRPACPECGSDAETGWREAEEIDYMSVDLADREEPWTWPPPRGPRPLVMLIVLVMILGLLALVLFR